MKIKAPHQRLNLKSFSVGAVQVWTRISMKCVHVRNCSEMKCQWYNLSEKFSRNGRNLSEIVQSITKLRLSVKIVFQIFRILHVSNRSLIPMQPNCLTSPDNSSSTFPPPPRDHQIYHIITTYYYDWLRFNHPDPKIQNLKTRQSNLANSSPSILNRSWSKVTETKVKATQSLHKLLLVAAIELAKSFVLGFARLLMLLQATNLRAQVLDGDLWNWGERRCWMVTFEIGKSGGAGWWPLRWERNEVMGLLIVIRNSKSDCHVSNPLGNNIRQF